MTEEQAYWIKYRTWFYKKMKKKKKEFETYNCGNCNNLPRL